MNSQGFPYSDASTSFPDANRRIPDHATEHSPNRPHTTLAGCRTRPEFTNENLQKRVARFLRRQHFQGFTTLEIDANDGVITISGTLDSYYQKQVALNSCQRVAGVNRLIDEIAVEDPS